MTVAKNELKMMNLYDYVVENDKVEHAVEKIKAIVIAEHCRRNRVEKRFKKILGVD